MIQKLFSRPLIKVSIRFGLISGIICIGLMITLFYIGKNPLLVNPYTDFRILLFGVLIFFMLKELRDYYFDGLLYFWQGMASSFIFLLITVMISTIGMIIFNYGQSDFLLQYIRQVKEQATQFPPETIQQIGKNVWEQSLSTLSQTTPADVAQLYALQCWVIGFFISIIISVILRQNLK